MSTKGWLRNKKHLTAETDQYMRLVDDFRVRLFYITQSYIAIQKKYINNIIYISIKMNLFPEFLGGKS